MNETVHVLRAGNGPVRIQECGVDRWKPCQKTLVEDIAQDECHRVGKPCLPEVFPCLGLVVRVDRHGYYPVRHPRESDGREAGTGAYFKHSVPAKPPCHMFGESPIDTHHEGTVVRHVVIAKFLTDCVRFHHMPADLMVDPLGTPFTSSHSFFY